MQKEFGCAALIIAFISVFIPVNVLLLISLVVSMAIFASCSSPTMPSDSSPYFSSTCSCRDT